MTFSDLRKQLTPPTEAQIADALQAELVALVREFGNIDGHTWTARDAASRVALRATGSLWGHGTLGDLIRHLPELADAGRLAAFGHDREGYAESVEIAVAMMDVLTAELRQNVEIYADQEAA